MRCTRDNQAFRDNLVLKADWPVILLFSSIASSPFATSRPFWGKSLYKRKWPHSAPVGQLPRHALRSAALYSFAPQAQLRLRGGRRQGHARRMEANRVNDDFDSLILGLRIQNENQSWVGKKGKPFLFPRLDNCQFLPGVRCLPMKE